MDALPRGERPWCSHAAVVRSGECEKSRKGGLTVLNPPPKLAVFPARGAIAQLGERLHGMQEVGGSIPPGSTTGSFQNRPAFSEEHLDEGKVLQRPHRLEA